MPRLKNCPFCGSDNIYIDGTCIYPEHQDNMYYVLCMNCEATIGRLNYEDVFEAWNRRADENDE